MQKDWIKFYKDDVVPKQPSSFARFVLGENLGFKIPGKTIIDIGCGNGRDTYYFGSRYKATGIDENNQPTDKKETNFFRMNWREAKELIVKNDIVYSRFFLHYLKKDEIKELIEMTPNYFIAEARAIGDQPKIYPEHERLYVDEIHLLLSLIEDGFEIVYFEKNTGLAKYKDEDPLIVRVIAKRIIKNE